MLEALDRGAGYLPANLIPLELLHVPGAVDLEVGSELEESAVRDDEGAALHGQEDERPLPRLEMVREEAQPVRVPFRVAGETQEDRIVEGARIRHTPPHRTVSDESEPGNLIERVGFREPVASYAVAERRLAVAIRDLHDYLWTGARANERELLARLLKGARALDRHLRTRGRVERAIRPLVHRFQKVTQGPDVFVFLQAIAGLSYAADRVRRNPREAAKASSELAVSLAIRLASAAGAHALVDAFEAGRHDFGEFGERLQDALEGRGVLRAAEFTRAANLAFDMNALWDSRASPATKRVTATAGVVAAGFSCIVFVDALRALGRYREIPYGRLVPLVAAILDRAGGQP